MTRGVELRFMAGDGFRSAFLTGTAPPGLPVEHAARELFSEAAAAVADHGIQPFREKIYGLTAAREAALAAWRSALAGAGLDPDLPCSFIQGAPLEGGDLAGIQIWGIVPQDERSAVATAGAGRCWQGPEFRLLHVPDVDGRRDDGCLDDGAPEQADRMFANAGTALRAHGFTFRNVVRTWIYLKRILDWYGDFNRVRTTYFDAEGIGMDPERSFPASTGIQGTAAGEECCMDLLAADGAGAALTPVHTSNRQGRSFDYGSAFSRAMNLRLGGLDTILVSGTASIDTSGNTLHLDNPEAQIRETLDCIFALLESQGGNPQDIVQATLFCKDPDFLSVYRRVIERDPAPIHPVVPVLADICRPDLLVEIEAIAVVPSLPGANI